MEIFYKKNAIYGSEGTLYKALHLTKISLLWKTQRELLPAAV